MISFQRLVDVARRHPLYEGWDFAEVEAFADAAWQRLPFLEADDLVAFRDRVITGEGGYIYFTSGTTETPKVLFFSGADMERIGELCVRFARFEGIGPHSRVMVLLPMSLWAVGRITIDGHQKAGATVFPVDLHGGLQHWLHMVREIRPTVISSTPSVLTYLAQHYDGPPLELVETTGEPLLETERRLIESRFGAFVHDAYGLSECVVGVECRMRRGFHVWPDATGVEIIDPATGEILPAGEKGEIVLTNFMQEALPILRYRSGDRGWLDPEPCPCGQEGPLLHLAPPGADVFQLRRGVQISRQELAAVLRKCGCMSFCIAYKEGPRNIAGLALSDKRPQLEIGVSADMSEPDRKTLRQCLLNSLPHLAEIVHEGEISLYIQEDASLQRR